MKKMSYFCFILLVGFILLNLEIKIKACDVPDEYIPNATYLYVIKNADVIVRATAIESVENKATGFRGVKFNVEEVLRGENIPSAIVFYGNLTDQDNFNKLPAPYGGVRSSGRNKCYALDYKRGAEFLLFLKKDKGKITDPYWKPLAPTNEQLHPKEDAWLEWVRKSLNSKENL